MLSGTLLVTLEKLIMSSMTPFAKNANQHRQKVPRYVDEGQLNEEKHNAALFPGHLRSDTTGGREKQIWHMYAHGTVKMLLFSRNSMKVSSL